MGRWLEILIRRVRAGRVVARKRRRRGHVATGIRRIVAAIGANDRAEFLRHANDDLRRAVTHELWEQNNQIAPHLNAGYKPTHVRRGEEEGFDVNVWKLSFEDGSSDVMLRLVTRGEQLAGIWRDIDAA